MTQAPVRSRMADRVAATLIVGIIATSPWPLGSRLPWAAMAVATVCLMAAAVWFAVALLGRRALAGHASMVPAAAFLSLAAWQWASGHTVYAHGTATDAILLAAYFAVFALVVQLASDADLGRSLQRAIVWTAVAVAVFGLVQWLTWNGLLFWIYDPPYAGARFGPFNNRNYFAGYVAATLPCALAVGLAGGRTRGRGIVLYLAWVAALASLVSLSRAGAAALAVGFAAVLLGMGRHARSPRRLWAVALASVGAVLFGLIGFGQVDRVLARLESVFGLQEAVPLASRVEIWRDGLALWSQRPIAGWGLGTFGWALPPTRTTPGDAVAMHAHNEYLEVLAETGLVGAALALAFLLLLLVGGRQAIAESAGSRDRVLRVGAFAGWIAIATYSLTDFPTIIPAIGIVLAVQAGLLLAPTPQRAASDVREIRE